MKIEALVTRKTQDLVQYAAEDLLRETVPGLVRIERGELWAFAVTADAALATIRWLLDETTLVVNPNIHRYSLEPWADPPAKGSRILLRVSDRVDTAGAAVLRGIRRRGIDAVSEVRRSVLWTLDLADADRAAAERIGGEVSGAGEETTAGVLANPHAQEVELIIRIANGQR
jgi:phosphoribosylformylglycinamidine (FGAM) synthase PurS component